MLCPVLSWGQYRNPSLDELTDSETVTAFKEHVGYFCSAALEGRAAGSTGEADAAAYVTAALREKGVDVLSDASGDLFGLKQEGGDTLTSRNVVAFIPGMDKRLRDHYIVIGARLDANGMRDVTVDGESRQMLLPSANGGASSLAMLIELAGKLQTGQALLGRSVLLLAFGASQQTFAGAWYFLNRSFPDAASIDAMVDLEALGVASGGFYAFTASNPDMDAIVESVNSTLQPVRPSLTAAQPFPTDQMAFYDREIPSVMFTTGHYKEFLTPMDTPDIIEYEAMENELEYIYNFTVTLSNSPRPVFDLSKELKKHKSGDQAVVPYYECDYKPAFLGKTDPRVFLEKWVYHYLKYPESAVKDGVQGRVLVDFIIDEKGRVGDVKVLRGVDPRLDAEAVRVIEGSPNWRPGYVKGAKVRAEMSLWIEFRLEKKNKK